MEDKENREREGGKFLRTASKEMARVCAWKSRKTVGIIVDVIRRDVKMKEVTDRQTDSVTTCLKTN